MPSTEPLGLPRRGVRARSALLLFVATFGMWGCAKSSEASVKLLQDLETTCSSMHESETLVLESVATFDWDRVLIAGPYTSNATIESALGTKLPEQARELGLEARDDVHLLLFVAKGKVVNTAAVPRRVMDFAKDDLLKMVARPDARFVLGPGRTFRRAG